ncbi:unnamed protein product, partial [Ixodes hexagonus]
HWRAGSECGTSCLQMVHALHTSGANSIWEHLLLEPGQGKGARRKPSADDCLHPTKADFIRAKHQNLAFVRRPSRGEEPSQEDLSQQLHSSVRTANLETSLRLLAQGAQPGMLHPEKGSAALHMAARAGQSSQVELLLVYGADPTALDALGHSPADYAREAGHLDLAQRLDECQFEVTDRLAFFLSGRKPDHHLGQHFILPEMSDCLELSELAKVAKHKLQMLPDALFAELARDVYDEVDRRENDALWLSTQNQSALVADRQSVPFLPVNPELSADRRRGRQKLARLNAREFASLIIDILSEAKRRHLGSQHCGACAPPELCGEWKEDTECGRVHFFVCAGPSSLSDDEPLYDSVASDEENGRALLRHELESLKGGHRSPARQHKAAPVAPPASPTPGTVPFGRTLGVITERLSRSFGHCYQIISVVELLADAIRKVESGCCILRSNVAFSRLSRVPMPARFTIGSLASAMDPANKWSTDFCAATLRRPSQRPQSMCEWRQLGTFPNNMPRDDSGLGQMQSGQWSHASGDYDNPQEPPLPRFRDLRGPSQKPFEISDDETHGAYGSPAVGELPSYPEVIARTERITRRIQELLQSAQEGKREAFLPCTENILQASASLDMGSLFVRGGQGPLGAALRQLLESARRLQREGRAHPETQQLIQCAYDVAKAAKHLVMAYPAPPQASPDTG